MKPRVLLFLAALAAAGCAVGPNYTQPQPVPDAGWHPSPNAAALMAAEAKTDAAWWRTWGDPTLTALIEQAARNNHDVRLAATRVQEARAMFSGAGAAGLPSLEASGTAQRQGRSENAWMPAAPGVKTQSSYYDTGFDASWELDIFGGVQRNKEAAAARAQVAEAEQRGALLRVQGEVARAYTALRGAQKRYAVATKNKELQAKTLQVARQRQQAGDGGAFEVARAEAQLRITEAALPNLGAEARVNAYALAVLTGQQPQALLETLLAEKPLPAPKDLVPVGLPSEMLRRRPDVQAAERQLAAETADVGVAVADLFPRFFLTGGVGVEALAFSDVFRGSSGTYALGPSIRWPLFQGGAVRARIRAQKAQAEGAAIAYEKAVLMALQEAESALVRYGEEAVTRKVLAKGAAAARQAVAIAGERYRAGEDNILAVVDAERELAAVEDALALSETRMLTHLAGLYKALGGGWEPFEKR